MKFIVMKEGRFSKVIVLGRHPAMRQNALTLLTNNGYAATDWLLDQVENTPVARLRLAAFVTECKGKQPGNA